MPHLIQRYRKRDASKSSTLSTDNEEGKEEVIPKSLLSLAETATRELVLDVSQSPRAPSYSDSSKDNADTDTTKESCNVRPMTQGIASSSMGASIVSSSLVTPTNTPDNNPAGKRAAAAAKKKANACAYSLREMSTNRDREETAVKEESRNVKDGEDSLIPRTPGAKEINLEKPTSVYSRHPHPIPCPPQNRDADVPAHWSLHPSPPGQPIVASHSSPNAHGPHPNPSPHSHPHPPPPYFYYPPHPASPWGAMPFYPPPPPGHPHHSPYAPPPPSYYGKRPHEDPKSLNETHAAEGVNESHAVDGNHEGGQIAVAKRQKTAVREDTKDTEEEVTAVATSSSNSGNPKNERSSSSSPAPSPDEKPGVRQSDIHNSYHPAHSPYPHPPPPPNYGHMPHHHHQYPSYYYPPHPHAHPPPPPPYYYPPQNAPSGMNPHAHGGSHANPYPREEEEEVRHRHQPYSDIMSTLPRGESLMRCYRYNPSSANERASCNRVKGNKDQKAKSAKKSQYVLHSYHELGDGNSNNASPPACDLDVEEEDAIPDFQSLVNFPYHVTRRSGRGGGSGDGLLPSNATFRRCVMCGEARKASHGAGSKKNPKKEEKNASTSTSPTKDAKATTSSPGQPSSRHIIPKQNKGLCTACDVAVWVVAKSGMKIKWCKGCKNFKLWKQFGEKTMATKCEKCREKQREKYAKKVGRDLVGNTSHQCVVGGYNSSSTHPSSTHTGRSGDAGVVSSSVGSGNGSSKGRDKMGVRRTTTGTTGSIASHGGLSFLIAATNQVE